ncbi:MAG TPA: hypothetical protein VLU24_05390, partial [Mycobacterium sp.]|nr:hypothetical protein [Mycobacterium sp.]
RRADAESHYQSRVDAILCLLGRMSGWRCTPTPRRRLDRLGVDAADTVMVGDSDEANGLPIRCPPRSDRKVCATRWPVTASTSDR